MAWRIADYIERGEIDNRTKDRITGQLWLNGIDHPIQLELTGNPYRDLAGQFLRFINPKPKPLPEPMRSFTEEQTGVVGDMTAARKVKVLDIADEEFEHYYTNKIPMPYHWGNCLYLEWHSVRNGRVVIEATDYLLEVEPEATWQMSEAEEAEQLESNGRAMVNFMEQIMEATAQTEAGTEDKDADAPQSEAEAEADAEAARMDLLMDRITARLDREDDLDPDAFERVMEEERERLRKERGEPEPEPLTPEEEAERAEWIAAANAAAEEAMNEPADPEDLREHPLIEHCHEFGSRIHHAIEQNGWLPKGAPEEHPLHAFKHGIWFASAKLAGALNGGRDEWPPEPMIAGNTLVRLKKARNYLQDSLNALEAIEAEKLTEPTWWPPLRQELQSILESVQGLIEEVRAVLRYNQP
jgi:hypothetical protein